MLRNIVRSGYIIDAGDNLRNWHGSQILIVFIAMLGASPWCSAGSERLIMSMTTERMEQMNLVFVRLSGTDGAVLESNAFSGMKIREQDCNSGHLFEITRDYKIGYAPKNMLVGIYLSPHVWNSKTLCFSIPGIGKIEQRLEPTANTGRFFQFQMAP